MTPLSTAVNAKIGQDSKSLLNKIYPIGAIYISVKSENPSTLFGGTWEQLQNRMLMAAGSTYGAGSYGGSATINLQHYHTVNSHNHIVDSHYHTTSGHVLTRSEMPNHSHNINGNDRIPYTSGQILSGRTDNYSTTDGSFTNPFPILNDTGRWRSVTSTDGEGGGLAHDHGNTGYASPNTSYSSPATNNQLSSSQSILPPYLSVYMWKRIA